MERYKRMGKNLYYKSLGELSKGVMWGGAFLTGATYLADVARESVNESGLLNKIGGSLFQHWLPVGEQFAMAASQFSEHTLTDSYVVSGTVFTLGLIGSIYARSKIKK